jgi:P-type E1-E2 ATPase
MMFLFAKAGDVIPLDGEIIEGLATIDESAITGESAPVIREAGGDKVQLPVVPRFCPIELSCR